MTCMHYRRKSSKISSLVISTTCILRWRAKTGIYIYIYFLHLTYDPMKLSWWFSWILFLGGAEGGEQSYHLQIMMVFLCTFRYVHQFLPFFYLIISWREWWHQRRPTSCILFSATCIFPPRIFTVHANHHIIYCLSETDSLICLCHISLVY